MYPNFKNLADKQRKRQELLAQIQRDLKFEQIKEAKYKEAFWANDVTNNKINIGSNRVNSSTQTDGQNGVFSLSEPDIGNEDDSLSDIDDSYASTRDMATSMDSPFRSESDMMQDEDYQSDIMRHRNHILDQNDEINRRDNQIRGLNNEIKSLNSRIEGMNAEFHNARIQFERLINEYNLSQRQIAALEKDFSDGRQYYLNLQAKAETIQYERDLTKDELENLKSEYRRGEELYSALQEGYKILQEDSQTREVVYNETIRKLKEENAFQTARVLEQQQQMKKMTVSETTSRNTRSNMNTPQALREYMQQKGVDEAPAATISGSVSKNIIFVIKDGKLHKRQNGKPDVNLEENTPESRQALTGKDPVWTMIAIKYSLPPGTRMNKNSLYVQEAKEIRDSGRLLTHQEGQQLMSRDDELRSDEGTAAALSKQRLHQSDKRERGESFYQNTTPIKEEKKKLKQDNDTVLKPYQGKQIGFSNLKGRGLIGAGVNGTTNLRERKGASSMHYRPLGSKFIRLPDLHNGILNVKFNNRTSALNKRKISDDLANMIKELVFDSNINQEKYDKLSHSDKKLFVDLLKMTHLQYHVRAPLEDPNKRLIAEFDKLRGELELGNNNPQLKMIILNTKISTYGQYDQAQKENENKLKETMSKIIVQEANEPPKTKKFGGKINPIARRELPVVYTNETKPKKVKTFKLII